MADKGTPKVTIDDLVETTAAGMLRALDARDPKAGAGLSTADLLHSGFHVDVRIDVGGVNWLRPKPEPPSVGTLPRSVETGVSRPSGKKEG